MRSKAIRFVDDYSVVVRFNHAPTFSKHGRKTDILVLSNSGDTGNELVSDLKQTGRDAIEAAREIWLARPPELLARESVKNLPAHKEFYRDYTQEIVEKLIVGKTYYIFSALEYSRVVERLVSLGGKNFLMPSSGILAVDRLLRLYPDHTIELFGFSHEGWGFHPWKAERKMINRLKRVRRL